ncbi:hypothetical protein SLEP1_g7764 [Rubroshorea leprosula]|uniref:WRKY domain-containing protein n=1 Tax=Rubroshorea leprosula TaxID=152421 RepID=A0AAV5HZG5_9ROSI|nr:hypothetical protein SLEP1_g7764 [Rubroshorea leprosula]
MSDEPRDHFYYNPPLNIDGTETSMYYNQRASPVSSAFDPSSYMSLTDCLHTTSSMDYTSLEKAFGLSPSSSEVFSSIEGNQKQAKTIGRDLGRTNSTENMTTTTTTTPNSSISSSSTEAGVEEDSDKSKKKEEQPKKESEDGGESSKKVNKTKKKAEKKQREPRFAFMTKSEVDHLEDGYRWRKYGQKAVKNSPYPRSYYRCTTQKCAVKKRVERSFQDPTIVITTYEGQHNHPLPTTLRGHAGAGFFPPSMLAPTPMVGAASSFPHELLMQINQGRMNFSQGGAVGSMYAQNVSPFHHQHHHLQQYHHQDHQVPDYGLLQDIVPPMFLKHEP